MAYRLTCIQSIDQIDEIHGGGLRSSINLFMHGYTKAKLRAWQSRTADCDYRGVPGHSQHLNFRHKTLINGDLRRSNFFVNRCFALSRRGRRQLRRRRPPAHHHLSQRPDHRLRARHNRSSQNRRRATQPRRCKPAPGRQHRLPALRAGEQHDPGQQRPPEQGPPFLFLSNRPNPSHRFIEVSGCP